VVAGAGAGADADAGAGDAAEAAPPASPGAGAPLEQATIDTARRRAATRCTGNESDYDASPAGGK
jgi:hypothetical protein